MLAAATRSLMVAPLPNSESSDLAAEPGDADLVLAAQTGDDDAFERLVRRHHRLVAGLLWRFTRQPSDLDDLVQEVFLRVVRHLPRWRPDQPFDHWLRRITVNVGRDFCRRTSRRRRWLPEHVPDPTAPSIEPLDPGADPAARAAGNEAVALLALLPADDRVILTLHHLEGWDFAAIGASLGWSTAGTKLRAFRARRRLRALLSAHDLL